MEGDGDGNRESPQVNQREEGEKKKSSDRDVGPSSRINEKSASGCDQDSSVYWESLLHQRSLHVLLVENDTSARLIIAVLLRKCGYRVTVAANGLQAWKILTDLSNHIDLVLSEVDIPCSSGIALLCNIMKHNICQHIPVVMMSFSDSITVVFKCLSEGAVDYLLKPVRKNELKNLWQHIWRRWHSSCGSESGIGAQPEKTVRLKDVEIFYDNNSSSNNKDDSASFGLNVEGGSDNSSDTQSSWTKEVNSSQPVSSLDQRAEKPDRNCALAIHSNFKVFGPEQLPTTATREYQAHKKQLDSREFQGSNKLLKNLERNKAIDVEKEGTPIHLGVKRLREVEDITTAIQDGHNLLRHWSLAVITRYNAASNANKAPCMSKESSSSHDHNSEGLDKEPQLKIPSYSNCQSPYYCFDENTRDIHMGSATNNIVCTIPAVLKDESASTSLEKCTHSCPVLPSMENNFLCAHRVDRLEKADDMAGKEMLVQPIAKHQELQIQHLDNCNHHHHLVQNIQQKLPPNHEDFSLKKMAAAAPQCGLSNILGGPFEGQKGSSVLDGSTSTCNKGGNNSNLRNATANAGGTKIGTDSGMAGKIGSVDATRSGGI